MVKKTAKNSNFLLNEIFHTFVPSIHPEKGITKTTSF